MRCFDGAVVNDKSISLRTIASEDGGAVEGEVKCLCEAKAGVSQEADLPSQHQILFCIEKKDLHRWNLMDQASCPMLSC
jgi:hypothetical protein